MNMNHNIGVGCQGCEGLPFLGLAGHGEQKNLGESCACVISRSEAKENQVCIACARTCCSNCICGMVGWWDCT